MKSPALAPPAATTPIRRAGRGRHHLSVARLCACGGLADPTRPSASSILRLIISTIRSVGGHGSRRHAAEQAIAQRERIAIHGDYDVDGITSTVILRRALELLGGDVTHFIPERLTDGYGLQPGTIDRLHAEGVQLIVSVDCGIRGAEAARGRPGAASIRSSPITMSHGSLPTRWR
jgi:single-stranded-DNA-specific exonuclease